MNEIKFHYVICIVGVGGTGGIFAKEFARYLHSFNEDGKTISFLLVDGDRVEYKNIARQPFAADDVMQNKAVSLHSAIIDVFELDNVHAYPIYIDTVEQMNNILFKHKSNVYDTVTIPIVVGGVDNHRCRQVLHELFMQSKDMIYIDSANEFTHGEVVIASKFKGKIFSPDRVHYYPEILEDNSPSASELSCGVINISAPQHLATNMMAANILLSSVVNVISNNSIEGGIAFFDSFKYSIVFRPYKEEVEEDV